MYTVEGNPLPKQSFKHSKDGGYTPARIKEWQDKVGWTAKAAMQDKGLDLFDNGRLHVTMMFHRGDRRRCDLDNLSKCVLDAMNGVVFADDKQVHWLNLTKDYDKDNPRAWVKVVQF